MSIFSKKYAAVLMTTALLCWPIRLIAASEAKEDSPVRLEALIEEALAGNPEVLSFKLRWLAAREEIPQAKSLDDPQLTITQWEIPNNFNIGGAAETWYGISQSFPFPGKRLLKEEIAGQASDAAESDYQAKVREITLRVKTATFQRFLIQKGIDLHLEHQALLTEFIQIATQKYAVGQASQQELLHAQVELSKLHNSLLVLEQERFSNTAELNTLLNRLPAMPLGPVETLEYRPFSLTFEELSQQALLQRPELKAATFLIEKSEQEKLLADKNFRPDFMFEIMRWEVHGGPNQWMANFKMNLPWVFADKYDSRIRQAAAEEAQARADQIALQKQTLFELRDLFTRVKTAEQLIGVYQSDVLPKAEQSLEASRIRYQAGTFDFLSLVDSERTLLDLQMEYVGALVLFWQSIAKLERVVGGELDI